MWFFMYTCYILSLLSLGMVLVVFGQSLVPFPVFNASPLSFLILTSIVYLLTETLIMFFFVGTGVSIKEYMLEHRISGNYHQRSIALKRKLYPPQLLNILILMTAFIFYGAADTGKVPVGAYQGLLLAGIIHFCYAKRIQHQCFRESTDVILAMVGINRGRRPII